MTPLMIALVIATAVGALVYVVASASIESADVRDSLRRLEGYQIQDVRDQEMLAPMSERVVAPLLDGLTGVATRFTPQGYGEKVAREAGARRQPAEPQRRQDPGHEAARPRVGRSSGSRSC